MASLAFEKYNAWTVTQTKRNLGPLAIPSKLGDRDVAIQMTLWKQYNGAKRENGVTCSKINRQIMTDSSRNIPKGEKISSLND